MMETAIKMGKEDPGFWDWLDDDGGINEDKFDRAMKEIAQAEVDSMMQAGIDLDKALSLQRTNANQNLEDTHGILPLDLGI